MTTRRNLLMMMAATAAATAAGTAGCRESGPPEAGAAVRVPDVLVGRTRDGLAVVRDGKLAPAGAGVLSMTGSTLCLAARAGGKTELSFQSTISGVRLGQHALEGTWTPRVTTRDGSVVALAAPTGDPAHPEGRAATTIVIADAKREVRRVTLPGVLEPDAFATDGNSLFVLEWLPANAPDHYRVRRLALDSRTLSPLFTRDKIPVPRGAEEEMRGEGRLAVPSPGNDVLYTLYTHQPGHRHTRDLIAGRPGNVHAFVHTLNMEQGWAYCVDLPAPFGESPSIAHTMTLSSDGSLLFVADVTKGVLARISVETLKVLEVVKTTPAGEGPAYAAAAGRRIYLGTGSLVQVLSLDGTLVDTWQTAQPLRGLAASQDSARVYLAHDGNVAWRDAATNTPAGEAELPGLTGLLRAA